MAASPPLDEFDLHKLALRYLREERLNEREIQEAFSLIQGKDPNAMLGPELTRITRPRSLLSLALLRGQWEIALALLRAGADLFLDPVESARQDKSAPIVRALSGALDIPKARVPAARKTIEELIARGALINGDPERSPYMFPLHLCAHYAGRESDPERFGAWAMPMVLELGADPNSVNDEGESALMMCARNNQPQLCQTLLVAGADDSLINHDGDTALIAALCQESFEAALALLERPSEQSLSHRAGHGRGPLSFACAASHMGARMTPEREAVMDRLMDLGQDLLEPDRIGATPLSHLQERPDPSFQRAAERALLRQTCPAPSARRSGLSL